MFYKNIANRNPRWTPVKVFQYLLKANKMRRDKTVKSLKLKQLYEFKPTMSDD